MASTCNCKQTETDIYRLIRTVTDCNGHKQTTSLQNFVSLQWKSDETLFQRSLTYCHPALIFFNLRSIPGNLRSRTKKLYLCDKSPLLSFIAPPTKQAANCGWQTSTVTTEPSVGQAAATTTSSPSTAPSSPPVQKTSLEPVVAVTIPTLSASATSVVLQPTATPLRTHARKPRRVPFVICWSPFTEAIRKR